MTSLSFGAWHKLANGEKGSERDFNSGGKTRGIFHGFGKGVPERVSRACSTANFAKTARNTFAEISGGYENRKEPQENILRLRLDTRRGI